MPRWRTAAAARSARCMRTRAALSSSARGLLAPGEREEELLILRGTA